MMYSKPLNQQRKRMVLMGVLYAGIGITLCGLIFTVIGIFGLVDAIRETQKTNSGINETILDCTDPDGKCAKESQDRIAGAVNSIGQLSVYASACAADVDPGLPLRVRVSLIQKCVLELADRPPATVTK